MQTQQRTLSDVFGVHTPEPVMIRTFLDNGEQPKTSDNYVFDKEVLKLVLAFFLSENEADGLLIHGPFGCGKTSLVREVLGRLNYPTRMFSWSENSDVQDLVGRMAINFGDTQFEYGPLPIAMQNGQCLVINEIDRGRAGNLVALNDVLDSGNLFIPETGERIEPHKNFRLVVTANSAGSGDRSGMYTGSVRKLDPAFLDRFIFLEAKYMPLEVEMDLLLRLFPGFGGGFLTKILEFANATRVQAEDHSFEIPFSTRSVKRCLRLAMGFGLANQGGSNINYATLKPAIKASYLDRLDVIDRETAERLLELKFGTS